MNIYLSDDNNHYYYVEKHRVFNNIRLFSDYLPYHMTEFGAKSLAKYLNDICGEEYDHVVKEYVYDYIS